MAAVTVLVLYTNVQGRFDEVFAVCDDTVHLQVAGCGHDLDHIVTGQIQLPGVDKIQDDSESLWAEDVKGCVDSFWQPVWPLGQQHPEVAAAGKQDVPVSPKELALNQHTAVAKQLLPALLV